MLLSRFALADLLPNERDDISPHNWERAIGIRKPEQEKFCKISEATPMNPGATNRALVDAETGE